MRASALTGVAAAATALAVVLSGCGSDTKTATTTSSGTSKSSSSSKETTATQKPKITEPSEAPAGPNPTIADYIKKNGITETPVKMGDPGSPTIDLPIPDGWAPLSAEEQPDWAYGVIVNNRPDAGDDPANIVAIVSKLTGNVDPQALLDVAPGELNNLPGYTAGNAGETSTLGEYPAYQLGGTWVKDGVTRVIAQKTVVFPAADGLFVLQLNADGLESSKDALGTATDKIDSDTTITP